MWAFRTADWCLLSSEPTIHSSESSGGANLPSLFKKPEDRWEVNDVRNLHQELAEGLETTLREFVVATRASGPLKVPRLPKINDAVPDDESSKGGCES
jgi:hypothetical protein